MTIDMGKVLASVTTDQKPIYQMSGYSEERKDMGEEIPLPRNTQ